LVALDNQPKLDFMFHDLRRFRKDTVVPQEVIEKRKENDLRRMSRVQLSKVLNRNLQTKKTRKYTQSLSLLAEEQMRKDLLDELQAQKNGGIDKN